MLYLTPVKVDSFLALQHVLLLYLWKICCEVLSTAPCGYHQWCFAIPELWVTKNTNWTNMYKQSRAFQCQQCRLWLTLRNNEVVGRHSIKFWCTRCFWKTLLIVLLLFGRGDCDDCFEGLMLFCSSHLHISISHSHIAKDEYKIYQDNMMIRNIIEHNLHYCKQISPLWDQ